MECLQEITSGDESYIDESEKDNDATLREISNQDDAVPPRRTSPRRKMTNMNFKITFDPTNDGETVNIIFPNGKTITCVNKEVRKHLTRAVVKACGNNGMSKKARILGSLLDANLSLRSSSKKRTSFQKHFFDISSPEAKRTKKTTIENDNSTTDIQGTIVTEKDADVIKTCGVAKKFGFSVEEDEKIFNNVKHAQEIGEDVDWSLVASFLPRRNPIQCARRYNKLSKNGMKHCDWTGEEDRKIMEHVNKVGDREWILVASLLPGRWPRQCSIRYKKLRLKEGISNESPTEQGKNKTAEVDTLSAGIAHVNMTTNDNEAHNTVMPKKKGNWSAKEDQKILDHVKDKEDNGEDVDWSLLASTVSGRNKKQCERRYNKLKNKKEKMKKGTAEENHESSKA